MEKTKNEFTKNLGDALQKRRVEMGITQEQLSEEIGLSIYQIGRIERGVHAPNLRQIISWSRYLHFSLDALFNTFPNIDDESFSLLCKFSQLASEDRDWIRQYIEKKYTYY